MIDLAGSPLAVVLLVVVLSFVGAVFSVEIKVSYTTVMIAIGLVLSYVKVVSEF